MSQQLHVNPPHAFLVVGKKQEFSTAEGTSGAIRYAAKHAGLDCIAGSDVTLELRRGITCLLRHCSAGVLMQTCACCFCMACHRRSCVAKSAAVAGDHRAEAQLALCLNVLKQMFNALPFMDAADLTSLKCL